MSDLFLDRLREIFYILEAIVSIPRVLDTVWSDYLLGKVILSIDYLFSRLISYTSC